ncbi:MAG: pyridoxal phosphate-dependent aminotransferase, partial [Vulcanimicrobiaceae bacterium]
MNPRVEAIPGSLIRQIAAKKRATSIDLGLGEPSLMPTSLHLDTAMEYVRVHGLRYTQNAGDPELRARIAGYYRYPGMSEAENVCVTTGSQEAMYVVIKSLLNPATDELLVVEPAFPSYVKMAALEGISVTTAVMREDENFAFDAEIILAAITSRTRAIVICSPCNPTGRSISRSEAEKLVAGLRSRGGTPIWLLHDEIYREQSFTDDAADLAQIYDRTIVTNSLSKSNALTGLRLGWIIAPHREMEAMIKCHAWVTSCADSFAQAVAKSIFETPGGIREHVAWYSDTRVTVENTLATSGLRSLPIDGSFYACVQVPGGAPSLETALALIEAVDVVTIPGIAFGSHFEGWLRLSWVAGSEKSQAGIMRIANHLLGHP